MSELLLISKTQKMALIIEPDIALAKAIADTLSQQGFNSVITYNLSDIRKRVNSCKHYNTSPDLIVMCPVYAGPGNHRTLASCASSGSITDYIRFAFPTSKIIYTCKPTQQLKIHEFYPAATFLDIKDESNSFEYKTLELKKHAEMLILATRRAGVERVLKQRAISRAEEAKRQRAAAQKVINNDMPAEKRLMFEELMIEMFSYPIKVSRKRQWAEIKYRASVYKYKLDMSYLRFLWKKYRKGELNVA